MGIDPVRVNAKLEFSSARIDYARADNHPVAMGMCFVPFGAVLDDHGMSSLKPCALATSALAAFVFLTAYRGLSLAPRTP